MSTYQYIHVFIWVCSMCNASDIRVIHVYDRLGCYVHVLVVMCVCCLHVEYPSFYPHHTVIPSPLNPCEWGSCKILC